MYVTIHTTFCFYAGRIELKKPCLITGILDCCRLFATRGGEFTTRGGDKYEPKSESPRDKLVQKLILYACERNMEAYDGRDKHGSEFICQNKTMSTDSLRVCVVLLNEDALCPMHGSTSPDRRETGMHTISNHVRRANGLRAEAFANSVFGVGRVCQTCGRSRDCFERAIANAGSLGLQQI